MLAAGALAAVHYARAGLALSHWDARAHLVVARRIFDSLTPGWQQIGAVWLPLPHLLNALPVQIDAWYRTGASGTAISVASMAAAAWALAHLVFRTTGSVSAALAGAGLLLLNPNTLYLQSTPMTEPLLFGTTFVAIALTAAWIDRGASAPPHAAGLALAAACLTRYEAWPITLAIIGLSALVLLRRGLPTIRVISACSSLAAYPLAAIAIFSLNSRWTTGEWFVGRTFFAAENEAFGRPAAAAQQVLEGASRLSGRATIWPAFAGAILAGLSFAASRQRAVLILVLGLTAGALLPWFAYLEGHPFRIRYSLSLVTACVALTTVGIALLPRRGRAPAAVAALTAALLQSSPLDRSAPVVIESLRDAQAIEARAPVTAYLARHHDGRTIMISMGSLAHYMHDLSRAGFHIRDFLHEGNGELWHHATTLGARGYVGWVIVEGTVSTRSVLHDIDLRNAAFLDGFERVAEGGGVVLFKRQDRQAGSSDPAEPAVRTGSSS